MCCYSQISMSSAFRCFHTFLVTHVCFVVALCLNWFKRFRSQARIARDVLSVSDLEDAKICVVRLVQAPFHSLLNSPLMEQHSPYVDDSGVIRVGGRLSRMSDSIQFKNPIILLKNSRFSTLVIRYSHLLTGHGGKGFTLNHVRQCGFFIINGVSLVKSIIFKCVGCRRLRAKQCSQKMSDLPLLWLNCVREKAYNLGIFNFIIDK